MTIREQERADPPPEDRRAEDEESLERKMRKVFEERVRLNRSGDLGDVVRGC
jgi:hypothetical protein